MCFQLRGKGGKLILLCVGVSMLLNSPLGHVEMPSAENIHVN